MQTTANAPTDVGTGSRLRAWLPRGDSLDGRAFHERHRTLSVLLALHVPVLIAFGIATGQPVLHAVAEMGFAVVFVGLAQLPAMPRRTKGILVSAGLVWCSAVLVHFSGGMIEAHFHFFIILGFIALYQDWAAFGWAIVFTAVSHGLGSTLAPDLMFNHTAAIDRPWTWALIHAGAVLFAAVGQVIGWRHAEDAQDRATALTTQLIREKAGQQASYARIYVNLARRNQSLLHRQVAVIDELERTEADPEVLRRLFTLDHLTTRIRRNAESLLVMAGEESPRRVSGSVRLADVVRAAASEVEQYARTDIRVTDPFEVTGAATVDLTHLLAELIENATAYSSPSTTVRITSEPTPAGGAIVVEDQGIGMSPDDLAAANEALVSPPELDDQVVRHLGFQVVGRLAAKLDLRVHLQATPGGGTTAVVEVPGHLLTGTVPAAAPVAPAPVAPAPTPVAYAPPPVPSAPTPEPVRTPLTAPAAAAPTPIAPAVSAPPAPAPAPPAPAPAPAAVDALPLLFSAKRPAPPPTPGAPSRVTAPVPTAPAVPFAAPTAVAPTEADVAPQAGGASPLPRRTPATSLVPELRDQTGPTSSGPTSAAPEARRALSAFQAAGRSVRDGRSPDEQGEGPT